MRGKKKEEKHCSKCVRYELFVFFGRLRGGGLKFSFVVAYNVIMYPVVAVRSFFFFFFLRKIRVKSATILYTRILE